MPPRCWCATWRTRCIAFEKGALKRTVKTGSTRWEIRSTEIRQDGGDRQPSCQSDNTIVRCKIDRYGPMPFPSRTERFEEAVRMDGKGRWPDRTVESLVDSRTGKMDKESTGWVQPKNRPSNDVRMKRPSFNTYRRGASSPRTLSIPSTCVGRKSAVLTL